MMKITRSTLAICILICILISISSISMAKMVDVEGHWAESTINSWTEKGLIKGFPDGTFKPENHMTRAEFFALLNRSFGFYKTSINEITSSNNEWFSEDVLIAKTQGYLQGLPKEILEIKEYISRQEVVSVLGRVMKLSLDKSEANKYADEELIAVWAREYVSAATKIGYIEGYNNNTFGPENNISRAEVVTILQRSMGELYNVEGTYGPISGTTTISGNSTISKSNVVLRNIIIEGNLYITDGIGDGTVKLDGVTVLGTTTISGGGKGIYIKDSSIGEVVINGTNTQTIYLVAQGKSKIGTVHVQSNAKLEEDALTGTGFKDVVLEAPEGVKLVLDGDFNKVELKAPSSQLSVLKGSYIKLLENNAKDAVAVIDKSAEIDTLTVNNSMKLIGKCTLETANINASNVSIEATPEELKKASGLTNVTIPKPVAPSSGGGGGGGGGGSGGGDTGAGGDTGGGDTGAGGDTGGGGDTPVPVVTILSYTSIADKIVPYGTDKASILPTTVVVKLSNGTSKTTNVAWDNGTPGYNGNTPGTYAFMGTITSPTGVTNPNNVKPTVMIQVLEEEEDPVAVVKDIRTVERLADITVDYGTPLGSLLPDKVEVTLDDNTKVDLTVAWNEGTPLYDGNVDGTYTFSGELTLPEGITNTGVIKAAVDVIVSPEQVVVDKNIVSAEVLADVTVDYGTSLGAIGLPDKVEVTLDDNTKVDLTVTWNEGTPIYDGNVDGTYVFAGELTLPVGITNTGVIKVAVDVIVKPEQVVVDKNIVSAEVLADITVDYGTSLGAIGLPDKVEVTLDDNTKVDLTVTWNEGTPIYDGNVDETYVFAGELTLPEGITNTGVIKAAVDVIVKPEQVVVVDKNIVSAEVLADITVDYGTSLGAIGLPDKVEVTLDDNTKVDLTVTWNEGTPIYDGNVDGTYVFAGELTLPVGITNTGVIKAVVDVIVKPEQVVVDKNITKVDPFSNILVSNGTTIDKVVFPTSAGITLSDGTSRTVNIVSWYARPDVVYDGSTDGYYPFEGILYLPSGISNPEDLKALVYVNVKSLFSITSVGVINNIEVGKGTLFSEIGLPGTVEVTVDYFKTVSIDVNWDSGTPTYDQDNVGSYEFIGELVNLPENVINPNPSILKALVRVMVYNPIDTDYIKNIDPNPNTSLNTLPGITIFNFDSKEEWIQSDSAMIQIDTNNYVSGTGSTNISPVAPLNNGKDYYIRVLTSGDLGASIKNMDDMKNIEFNLYIPEKGQIEYVLIKFYTDQWNSIFFENGIGDWELSPGWNKIRRTKDDFIFKDTSGGSSTSSMSRTLLKSSASVKDPRAILQEKIDYMDNFLLAERERALSDNTKMQLDTMQMSTFDATDVNFAATNSWGSVNKMEVFVTYKYDKTPTINLDKIAINTTGKAKVLFTFDDAWLSVLEKAYPILKVEGFKATTWANMEAVLGHWDDGEFMNVANLKELYDAGWDIGNHTVDHPDDESTLTEAELRATYKNNQDFIERNEWFRGARHVCYPSGSFSDSLIEILQDIGVKTARTTVYGIDPTPVSNIYKLKTIAVGRDTDLDKYVKFEIDRAIATGSSLFFMFHRVEDVPEADDNRENYGQIAVSTENFQIIVDYIASLRDQIDVVTISEWYEAYMTE